MLTRDRPRYEIYTFKVWCLLERQHILEGGCLHLPLATPLHDHPYTNKCAYSSKYPYCKNTPILPIPALNVSASVSEAIEV